MMSHIIFKNLTLDSNEIYRNRDLMTKLSVKDIEKTLQKKSINVQKLEKVVSEYFSVCESDAQIKIGFFFADKNISKRKN